MTEKITIKDFHNIENVIIVRSGEIQHLKELIDYLKKNNRKVTITCIVQKEFEKAALSEKRISNVITLEKIGDYSFKFSIKALMQIRENRYDLAIALARSDDVKRDRRAHILMSLIKSKEKLVSLSNGTFQEFKLHLPIGNLLDMLLSNLVSLIDILMAKLVIGIQNMLIPVLKILLKKRNSRPKNTRI